MEPNKRRQIRSFRSVLRRFERVHKVLMEDRDCCSGLTIAQCHPLLEIDAMGETSLSDLATRLHLDASTLSRTIEGLVRSGLVDRRPNRHDRRYVVLSLTPEGTKTCNRINDQNDRLYDEILSRLPSDRRDEAIRLFDDLVRALDETVMPSEKCCGEASE